MITTVEKFLLQFAKKHGPFDKALDVGSLDVNGSVRKILKGQYKEITGIDMRKGEGVDIVMNAHDLDKKWPNPTFDLVTCVETLEHDDRFWITVEQIKKVLKPGGWMLIAAPSLGMGKHDYPGDYYRFFASAFEQVFFKGFKDVHVATESYPTACWVEHPDGEKVKTILQPNELKPDEILGYGRKP